MLLSRVITLYKNLESISSFNNSPYLQANGYNQSPNQFVNNNLNLYQLNKSKSIKIKCLIIITIFLNKLFTKNLNYYTYFVILLDSIVSLSLLAIFQVKIKINSIINNY